ncbi:MAG: hypothetical protein H7143_01960 [Pseudorhodobacter sp.]|nr:hypothetical protein [Rhizobacter sp.]
MKTIADAVLEARALAAQREWQLPTQTTLDEAQRLLDLVSADWPAPDVQAQANGGVALEWEVGAHGWLTLIVLGQATVEHAAVIAGDEYGLTEPFADVLPGWAQELLQRLHQTEANTAPQTSPKTSAKTHKRKPTLQ